MEPAEILSLEELTSNVQEWSSIQPIVKYSIFTLIRCMKSSYQSMEDLRRQLGTKLSRSDGSALLAKKADQLEVTRSFGELEHALASLRSSEQVSKPEFIHAMNTKVSSENFNKQIDLKADKGEWREDWQTLYLKLEILQKEINKKLSKMPNEHDFGIIKQELLLKADKAEMENALDEKATKQSMANALQRKANKAEIDGLLNSKASLMELRSLSEEVNGKAPCIDLQELGLKVEEKVGVNEFHDFLKELREKTSVYDFEILRRQVETGLSQIEELKNGIETHSVELKTEASNIRKFINTALTKKGEAKDLETIFKSLNKKVDSDTMIDSMNSFKQEQVVLMNKLLKDWEKAKEDYVKISSLASSLQEDFESLNEKFSGVISLRTERQDVKPEISREIGKLKDKIEKLEIYVDELPSEYTKKNDFDMIQSTVKNLQENKANILDMQRSIMNMNNEISENIRISNEKNQKSLDHSLDLLQNEINARVTLNELYKVTKFKLDKSDLSSLLEKHASIKDIKDIKNELSSKSSVSELEEHIKYTKRALEAVAEDISNKANVREVCELIDSKANIEDTNSALLEIHKELDIKANASLLQEHESVLQVLLNENFTGKWIWSSGNTRSSLVPWEIQTTNAQPECFVWEVGRTHIIAVLPGLYEVKVSVFSKKKPSLQILLNGEPTVSSGNALSQSVHHKSSKTLSPVQPNLVGHTLCETFCLAGRVRVSVSCSTEGSEGVLSIKKL